jgi:hypothetical protein
VQDRSFGRPLDDLDQLLRAFLRAEMPDPWPVPKALVVPQPRRVNPSQRYAVLNSRFALAATVAFCLVGSLALASVFSTETPAGKGLTGTNAFRVGAEEITNPNGDKLEITVEESGKVITIRVSKKPAQPGEVELGPMPPEE